MNEEEEKSLAAQLRKPTGNMGLQVGERMNDGNQFMNRHTIEKLDPQPNDKILEIGMGNGFFVKEILAKDPSIKYVGCDFSELMVEASKNNNQEFLVSQQASFFHATADQLPLENESFDKIFTVNTLYFWESPSKDLAELKRVLKSTGRLFITIRPKKYIQHFGFTKYGFHMYSCEEAEVLLTSNGWDILDITEKTDPPIDFFGVKLAPECLIFTCKLK